MKKRILAVILVLSALGSLPAQMTVSGVLDTSVSMNAVPESNAFTTGFEEYANIRFQSRLRDNRAVVYGAVNLIAASGDSAYRLMGMQIPVEENFIAAIELERLYFRLNGEHVDLDAGLFRLPFGYGQVWSPSDFLNPKDPLKPDARHRAVIGAALTWYPIDELKLLGFYAAPRDPLSNEGKGSLFGLSLDRHWEKLSIQTLYSFETPDTDSAFGIHRAGLSIKVDIEIGLYMDMLYTYNYEAKTELDGLSITAGADYSFFDGNLIALAAYLYDGDNSLYAGLTWRFNDFTNLSAALITNFDNAIYTPLITLNHDLFQGAVFTISLFAPFDTNSINSVSCTAKIRLRF